MKSLTQEIWFDVPSLSETKVDERIDDDNCIKRYASYRGIEMGLFMSLIIRIILNG